LNSSRPDAPRLGSPRPNPVTGCPLTAALTAFGGKWKLIIIYWLAESPAHFAGLRRLIPGISAKVLTEQLRELTADGIIAREPSGDVPDPVIYSLTEYGTSLLPIVEAARTWGNGHLRRTSDAASPADTANPTAAATRAGSAPAGNEPWCWKTDRSAVSSTGSPCRASFRASNRSR
jgi:DNA-binding HxlR family transcriptional regulator